MKKNNLITGDIQELSDRNKQCIQIKEYNNFTLENGRGFVVEEIVSIINHGYGVITLKTNDYTQKLNLFLDLNLNENLELQNFIDGRF